MNKSLLFFVLVLLAFSSVKAQTSFYKELADSAATLTYQEVKYDPSYFSIAYPNGDVPANRGVCTDVVIRAYRKVGIDLQKLVHEDMTNHFEEYPNIWGLQRPDTNIDHRRVPNLMVYFERQKASLPISEYAKDYKPGDMVTWDLGNGMIHIGIVSKYKSKDENRLLIVHNIGKGQVLEDILFNYKIIGHYRFK